MDKTKKYLIIAAGLLTAASLSADSLSLSEKQVIKKGTAKTGYKHGVIELKFDNPGWESGVKIMPPAGEKHWDLSGWKVLAADAENLSKDKQLRLVMFVYAKDKNTGKKRHAKTGLAVNPGERRSFELLIPHRSTHAAPKGIPGPRAIDSDVIDSIEIYQEWTFEGKAKELVNCRISNLRVEGRVGDIKLIPEDKFFPFIDKFGQYTHQEWPDKIHSVSDLKAKHQQELKELSAAKRPASWNRYGGWKNGPQLKATGNFRVEKYQGKWYFVDPDGKLFFSHGIDVLYPHTDATSTKDHEKWFESKIPKSGKLAFTDTNLQLKYGKEDYAGDFYNTLARRLEYWGFNTIGNWGNKDFIALGSMPYTMQLTDYNWKMPRISGSKLKFYDVFDRKFIDGMKNLIDNAAKNNPIVTKSLTDPLCIGYFIDNELNFGNRRAYDLIKAVLKSPAKQAMKQEYIKDLKSKYTTIEKLNAAWATRYADWQTLLADRKLPKFNNTSRADAKVFMRKCINQYFRLCRDAIKSKAPYRLYLGCRFIGTDSVRPMLYEASKKYCDVLTVNIYAHSTANFDTPDFPDMPVLIGEFHFGVYDRGMFSPGLCPAGLTQQDRALAYTRFLQGALVNPRIVGTHWFQFRDQPLTGRWDGEGYAIGFVDVADTPYREMIEASREIGKNMYEYRLNGTLKNEMR